MHVRNDRVFFGHRCMQPSQGKIVACVSNFGSMLFQELAGSFVAHETDLTNPLRKKTQTARCIYVVLVMYVQCSFEGCSKVPARSSSYTMMLPLTATGP